jgi:hypothetical protein
VPKREWKTAAELEAELRADPEFQEQERERDTAFKERWEKLIAEEAPLVEELKEAGFEVEEVTDLLRLGSYSGAIPILLEHLRRPYSAFVKGQIAFALNIPEAVEGWEILLNEFEAAPSSDDDDAKWWMATALSTIAREHNFETILRLVREPRHGENRIAFFKVLERSTDPRARDALIELSSHAVLGYEAKKSLKRLERKKSRTKRRKDAANEEPAPDLSETSMNFDSELVEPFLERVSTIVSGFGGTQIAKVTELIDELDVDEEEELRFEVEHGGRATPLRIRVFMDDADAPDLYFFTSPELAAEIEELYESFCEEHGI